MSEIYDSVFRTLINDCKQRLPFVLNEVFGENYDGTETVTFHPNEHFISRYDEPDDKRITDTNFTVAGKITKEYHLECESSKYSSQMLVRIFEYDAQIALDHSRVEKNCIKVRFPNTAVLYLRSSRRTPDSMKVVIETPGGTVSYDVPVMKMSDYSADDIFRKKLYILLPFYIFNFEKKFKKYSKNKDELKQLTDEYEKISLRLQQLTQSGEITSFEKHTISKLSGDVADQIADGFEQVQKGVHDTMCGPIIVTEAREILEDGIEIGFSRGEAKGEAKGENKLSTLFRALEEAGRKDDAFKAASDAEYRQKLYKEFGIE